MIGASPEIEALPKARLAAKTGGGASCAGVSMAMRWLARCFRSRRRDDHWRL